MAAKAHKEEIMIILSDVIDDESIYDIEKAIVEYDLPIRIKYSRRVKKNIRKLKKINKELAKLIKKCRYNPKCLNELIPIDKVKQSPYYSRYHCY